MLALYLSMLSNDEEKSLFEELYVQHRRQMLIIANSVLRNEADAEDTVHDVFCTIAANMDTIKKIPSPSDRKNYLLKSVKNKAISKKQRQQIHRIREADSAFYRIELGDADFVDGICNRAECAELAQAIDELDDKYRDVIYYRFVLDLTTAETAALLDRNVNTVRKQIDRAKAMLVAKFKEKENENV